MPLEHFNRLVANIQQGVAQKLADRFRRKTVADIAAQQSPPQRIVRVRDMAGQPKQEPVDTKPLRLLAPKFTIIPPTADPFR